MARWIELPEQWLNLDQVQRIRKTADGVQIMLVGYEVGVSGQQADEVIAKLGGPVNPSKKKPS